VNSLVGSEGSSTPRAGARAGELNQQPHGEPLQPIQFGTDGWRAVIADDFTFANVRRVSGAIASYVLNHEDAARGIIVGYDTRFGSPLFARAAAEVLASAGIRVKLANDYVPTPAVSFAVKNQAAAGGVMITSSHNPWNWNGVKFKAKFGGSATPAIMKIIQAEAASGAAPQGKRAAIEEVDLKPDYVASICRFADLKLIARAGFKLAIDSMYGSGRGVLGGIFGDHGIETLLIRQEVDPLFPGINPEPIEPHVRLLEETVVARGCHAGFVTDGDADRIGAVAEDGSFVDAHKVFSVLLDWVLSRKRWSGEVVRAFNTTSMVDRIARKHGRKLHECPIGFKHIADLMMEREIAVGGEESGGIGYSRYLPERDGILNSLLLANVMAEEKRPLGELVARLQREYGPHFFGRRDLRIADEMKYGAIERARSQATRRLGNYGVSRKEGLDGIKVFLDAPRNQNGADAWVLFRASGTEPLLRVYAEAATPALVEDVLHAAEAFVRAG
jgi:phosphomannomutase